MKTSIQLEIPRRKRGRPSDESNRKFHEANLRFAEDLHSIKVNELKGRRIGPRSWGYVLENMGAITKAEFDRIESLISNMRKKGYLPLDFTSDDEARRATEVNPPVSDELSLFAYAEATVNLIQSEFEGAAVKARQSLQHNWFCENSFWDYQQYYVEVFVEKGDLRDLFESVCSEYHIPISNSKGWSDLHSRAAALTRMQQHAEAGRIPVCLLCGDLDPAGLNINSSFRKNLQDLVGAYYDGRDPIQIDTDNIIMDRFGLTEEFISEHNLTWIDNLLTGSGEDLANPKHDHYNSDYVQRYLREIGERKCEANALIVRPAAAAKLMRETILKYIDTEAEERRKSLDSDAQADVTMLMQEIANDRDFLPSEDE